MRPDKILEFIFFGNYFYAFCAAALSVEASLQQNVPLNTPAYYCLLISGTIVYYTYAYLGQMRFGTVKTKETIHPYYNKRTQWYKDNYSLVSIMQLFFILIMIVSALYLSIIEFHEIFTLRWDEWVALLIVPLVAILYYGNDYFSFIKINIRKSGIAKPFLIGFVWAAAVSVYPVMFYKWQINRHYQITFLSIWFFVKNWMFISMLCIMFDIKDYADDSNKKLKTFVVRVGLRKTIFYILLPLTLIGLLSLWAFGSIMHFSFEKILINTIPFVCLLIVAYSMQRRRPILYYLIIIDGLMLVKAFCGIAAAIIVK
ncbi:MAG: hypothetical protein PW786_07000 [Arachidicoccus sp.]|nr:hypothetical protein [Arachidicoccus sp.]